MKTPKDLAADINAIRAQLIDLKHAAEACYVVPPKTWGNHPVILPLAEAIHHMNEASLENENYARWLRTDGE